MELLKAVFVAMVIAGFFGVLAVTVFNTPDASLFLKAMAVLCALYGISTAAVIVLNAYSRRLDRDIEQLTAKLKRQRDGEDLR